MAIEYDAMGNATGITTPESGILTPAQMRTDKPRQDQTRQMQGFLKVGSGFAGKLTGTNDAETKSAIEKFQKENGLDPAKASPEETLSKMRANLLQNPKAVESMKTLIDTKDPDNVKAAQYGLAAFGAPLEPNGQVNVGTTNALDRLVTVQATKAKEAVAAAPKFDPQIQKAQGYMRMMGLTDVEVDGQKKRLVVDGMNGTNTQTALTKYNADHGLAKDAGLEVSLRHMEENLKKNGPELQQRLNGIMEQGTGALRSDVRGMQLTMNLLKNESLKVDGINGINTTAAYNKYSGKNYPVPTAPVAAAPASADPLGDFISERGLDKPEPAASAPAPAPVAQPQIHIAPGQETPGIQPRSDGVIPTLVVGGEDPAVSGSKRENAAAPASRPVVLKSEYNRAGIEALPPLQERLQERADRITGYTAAGMTLRDASRQVSLERRQELAVQGLDRNTINAVAGGEEGIERSRISQIEQQQRMMERQQQQEMAATRREVSRNMGNGRAAAMENERDGRALGNVAADFGGLRGNERRMAQALGGLGGRILGALGGDDRPSTAQDRENGRFARDIGGAAGGGTYGRAAEILVRRGGEVITYPQQDRSGMPQTTTPSGKWDSNQISAAQRFSAAYGSSPEERQQLLANQAAQPAMADNSPAALNTDPIRRIPTNNGP